MGDKTLGEQDVTPGTDDNASGEVKTTKTFTQEEVNAIVARQKAKALKAYEDLGDPEELRELRNQAKKAQEEQALKRGEFDKILQEKISAKDLEIQKRDNIIKEYKIDLPLVNAAATFKSVNPEQVKALLKNQVRIGETGEVEVVDHKGVPMYDSKGVPFTVEALVKTFLDSNPHFVQPTPAGTNSKNSFGQAGSQDVDVSTLSDAEYRAYRKAHGLDKV